MKFVVEDTYNGYRLTMLDSQGAPRHHFDEEDGNGDIEGLYNDINSVWGRLRIQELRRTRAATSDPS